MSEKSDNGRTHEPSLRELTADLDGVKQLLIEKINSVITVADERDRRYEDRFKATDEKTSLALAGSEKAVTKAEAATEKRFDAVNEFRGTLSDQAASLLPRAEANANFRAYDEKIEEMKKQISALRETQTKSMGEKDAQVGSRQQTNWGVTLAVTIGLGILAFVVGLVSLIMTMKR